MTATETFILFGVAGTTYALRSRDVAHVEMVEQVTAVPNAVPFVDGVVFSRGEVVPALNLRARFGFEKAPYDLSTRLLVVRAGDRTVGLVVDAAREFVAIDPASIQPPAIMPWPPPLPRLPTMRRITPPASARVLVVRIDRYRRSP